MSEERILAAEWVVPVSAPPLKKGAVVVRRERILGVGPAADLLGTFPGAEVKDFGAAAILPGFVNLHTHLELTGMRGYLEEPHFISWLMKVVSARARLSEEDLLTSALAGAVESIRAGITTLGDVGYSSLGFEAMRRAGLRGVFFQEITCMRAKDVERDFAEFEGKISAVLARETSRLKAGVSPHSPYTVCAAMFDRVGDWLEKQPVPVSIHAGESIQELEFLNTGTGDLESLYVKLDLAWEPPGCSSIAYLDRVGMLELGPLLAHAVQINRADVNLIAQSAAKVAHCPKSNAKLGHGIMPLFDLREAGVMVGLGTDGAGSNNSLDLLDEARFCGLVHRASRRNGSLLPADELLRLMTVEGARALGLGDKIGTLEPGGVGNSEDIAALWLL